MKMPESQPQFAYTEEQLTTLESAISLERLTRYTTAANGDRRKAIRLYEQNTALSEALYGVLQGLEITLRNSIHNVLRSDLGRDDWYDHFAFEPWEEDSIQKAKRAAAKHSPAPKSGKVIAELSFGFWTGLISKIYEKRLWVPHIYKAFPAHRVNRRMLYGRLNNIRNLRNRIAHHEPILGNHLEEEYKKILEITRWIDPTTADWIASTNCFTERWRARLTL